LIIELSDGLSVRYQSELKQKATNDKIICRFCRLHYRIIEQVYSGFWEDYPIFRQVQ